MILRRTTYTVNVAAGTAAAADFIHIKAHGKVAVQIHSRFCRSAMHEKERERGPVSTHHLAGLLHILAMQSVLLAQAMSVGRRRLEVGIVGVRVERGNHPQHRIGEDAHHMLISLLKLVEDARNRTHAGYNG